MRCMLTAMRDRTPATHVFGDSFNGGQFSTTWAVEMLSNGLVIWRVDSVQDLGCQWRETQTTPPDTVYLDDCLASQDPEQLWSCLWGMFGASECALAPAVCP